MCKELRAISKHADAEEYAIQKGVTLELIEKFKTLAEDKELKWFFFQAIQTGYDITDPFFLSRKIILTVPSFKLVCTNVELVKALSKEEFIKLIDSAENQSKELRSVLSIIHQSNLKGEINGIAIKYAGRKISHHSFPAAQEKLNALGDKYYESIKKKIKRSEFKEDSGGFSLNKGFNF